MTKTILQACDLYTTDDYPYGRLRCTRTSWLEPNKKGDKWRICHQTTNPKTGKVNKPKKSTYAYLAACMYLDEDNHLQWSSHSEYNTAEESQAFLDEYRTGLHPEMITLLNLWIEKKTAYESALADGSAYFTINGKRV